jgi:hypothetical protein
MSTGRTAWIFTRGDSRREFAREISLRRVSQELGRRSTSWWMTWTTREGALQNTALNKFPKEPQAILSIVIYSD